MRVGRIGMRASFGAVLLCGVLACESLPEDAPRGAATQQLGTDSSRVAWVQIDTPDARSAGAMAYDAARQRLVLVSGLGTSNLQDTWEWNGDFWTRQVTGNSFETPSPRSDHGLVFDEGRQRIVLFGGADFSGMRADTWEWDGIAWKERPGSAPPARAKHAVAYDRTRHVVVLFGGTNGQQALADTWEWDGNHWNERTSNGDTPSARQDHALAYDESRQRTVLFAGQSLGNRVRDTWEWDGASWTQLTPASSDASPPARIDHALAYDAARARVVLFGGSTLNGRAKDTWTWDGASWSNVTPVVAGDSPTARDGAALAYERPLERLVLFGGSSGAGAQRDTWCWTGTRWQLCTRSNTTPLARENTAVVGHPALGHALLFGGFGFVGNVGTYFDDTWIWDGGYWLNRTPAGPRPPGRRMHQMTYDVARGRVVLVGGIDANNVLFGDTWEWNGESWEDRTPADPAQRPSARYLHAMAYDEARGVTVLIGGYGREDVWEWNGATWQNRTPVEVEGSSPFEGIWRYGHALGYDPLRQRVVLFGGSSLLATYQSDTWEWDGSTFMARTPDDLAASPPPRTQLTMAYDHVRQHLVLFGGVDDVTSLDDGWEWDGEAWNGIVPVNAQSSPSHRYRNSVAFDPVQRRIFTVAGSSWQDGSGQLLSAAQGPWWMTRRGGACTSAADSTTGFCVDGVSCISAGCNTCERCDAPSDPGRCSLVTFAEDPDSCSAATRQQCDGAGRCLQDNGSACSNGTACVTGQCVAGICCESACTGSCQSCKASENVVDRDGICAPVKAGLDPNESCADDGVDSCQRDGTCDGRGACRLYTQEICNPCERTCTGPCESCKASENILALEGICAPVRAGLDPKDDCPDEGALSCKRDGTCDGTRACRLYSADACGQAHCKDALVLEVPGREDVRCAPYSCVDSACRTTCESVADCAPGAVCDSSHRCAAAADSNASESGCSCHTAGRPPRFAPWSLLIALGVLVLRRRRALGAVAMIAVLTGCATEPPASTRTSQPLLTSDTLRWLPVGDPSARKSAGLVYDDAIAGLVLFGGSGDGLRFGDTWQRHGKGWVQRTVVLGTPEPSRRVAPGFAYDSARQRVVLHGGQSSVGSLGDTWEWDGKFWRDRTPTASAERPSARSAVPIVFDAARGRTVLFGGESLSLGFLDDTWTWDGARWESHAVASRPPPREDHALAYDAIRQRVVLVGGRNLAGPLRDTWEWDGVTWMQRSTASDPPARSHAAMAYDAARARVVLFGGRNAEGVALRDLWEWDGTTWTDRTASELTDWPEARDELALAYDPGRQRIVLIGGLYTESQQWEWDGAHWENLVPPGVATVPPWRYFHTVAYDEARDRVVLFGGNDDGVALSHTLDDTWEFDGASWHDLRPADSPSPPARMAHGLVYDKKRQRVVLFGGGVNAARQRDTWEWDGATWTDKTPADPAASPAARSSHVLIYDDARERVLMFGGSSSTPSAPGYLQDLWEWDGVTWTERTPAAKPPTRTFFGLAYDQERELVTLHAGRSGTNGGLNVTNDTWEWNGEAWSNVTDPDPAQSTGGNALHTLVYDPMSKRSVSFGGWQSPGPVNAMYMRESAGWVRRYAENEMPGARFGSGATYMKSRHALFLFAGSGSRSDTWLLESYGGPCQNDADSTSGHCVDGVACDTVRCATCERCDLPGSLGHCSAVVQDEDPDSCHGVNVCNREGRCTARLGAACTDDAGCGEGTCVRGACCDSACSGSCESCKGSENILDRDGICAPTKPGLDPKDDCVDDGVDSCQRDGACDGARACRLYTRAVCNPCERSCTGPCESCKGSENIADLDGVCAPIKAGLDPKDDCADDGIASCQRDGTCNGSRGCRLYAADVCGESKCKDSRTLTVTGGDEIDCAPYVCEGSACKTRCASIADCSPGAECSASGECTPPADGSSNDQGCSCDMAPARSSGLGLLTLGLVLTRRRKRRVPEPSPGVL